MSDGLGYEANLQRGQLLRQNGRLEDACRFLGEAIQADPEQSQAYLELALAQSEIPGKKADSLRSIDRAVSLSPHSARVIGYKAYILSHLGRHAEALQVGKRALEIDPTCYIALLAHANAYTKLGRPADVEAFSRRILANYPNDIAGLNLLAQALRFLNRPAESRAVVEQILSHVPNDGFGHTNAGYEALKIGDYRRAEDHFRTALSRDPDLAHARSGLLQAFRMRSWFFRLNFDVLMFFDDKAPYYRAKRVSLVILSFITLGFFFGVIVVYLLIALTIVPLSNLFLVANPLARHAFDARQWRWIWMTAVMTFLFLLSLLLGRFYEGFLIGLGYLLIFATSFYIPGWIEAGRTYRKRTASLTSGNLTTSANACDPATNNPSSRMGRLSDYLKSLFSSSPAAPTGNGLLGANLPSVQQTHDLFTFFNFAPTGTESLSGQRVATAFKPTGEAFRDLVTFYVTTDTQGTIQVLRLVVVRSFIDNPATCIYAADLAKSFLGSLNPGTGNDQIAALAQEISARAVVRSSLPMLTAQALPTAKGEPSPACGTYLGRGSAQTLFNPASTVQLLVQNDFRAAPPTLEMILSARSR